MPLQIVRNDITKMKVDAIVNAANNSLLGGGGVDGSIHRAAGLRLLAECRTLGGCETGGAKVTKGYDLPCKYVIHTVGPVWQGGAYGERELLLSCYRMSLELALEKGCETVAFPLISAGAYGYPKDQALQAAVSAVGEFLLRHDMTVYIVIYDKSAYQISGKLFADVAQYIDDHYVEEHTDFDLERRRQQMTLGAAFAAPQINFAAAPMAAPKAEQKKKKKTAFGRLRRAEKEESPLGFAPDMAAGSLDEALKMLDESFSEMLLRKIDERGMTEAECYKKANIDRKLFSKIRSDRFYKPSKPTVLAFAIALELPLDETKEMLMKAGFALSRSSKFDVIIEYFIVRENYDIYEINEALFAFDQSLLGG